MKINNLRIGNLGENIARQYLESKGYNIIESKLRNKYSEIDLIVKDSLKTLIFVEVRTKTNEEFGSPEESVDKKKYAGL